MRGDPKPATCSCLFYFIFIIACCKKWIPLADPRGARDVCPLPHPGIYFFFCSMQFSGKNCRNNRLASPSPPTPPSPSDLESMPRLRNPGSTTEYACRVRKFVLEFRALFHD